jgi:hypothetical protein
MKVYHNGVLGVTTSIAATALGRFTVYGLVWDDAMLTIVRSGEWEIVPGLVSDDDAEMEAVRRAVYHGHALVVEPSLSLAEDEGEDHAQ